MFDKTFNLTSSDGTVTLSITAGTEGVKSILLSCPPAPAKLVTQQQLIDLMAPPIRDWFARKTP